MRVGRGDVHLRAAGLVPGGDLRVEGGQPHLRRALLTVCGKSRRRDINDKTLEATDKGGRG